MAEEQGVELGLRVGVSSAGGAHAAAEEAVAQAMHDARDAVFALVLATDQYDAESLAAAVNEQLGLLPWAGCTASGVIAGGALLRKGLVIGVFTSRTLRVGVGVAGRVSTEPREAGVAATALAVAAMSSQTPHGTQALIVLPDAVRGNAAEVVRGAASEAGTGPAWTGGGSGDNLSFVRSSQFARGRAYRDHVVVVALGGAGRFATGTHHGYHPYGPPALVTRAGGAVAAELDFEAAFEVYRRTAAERGDEVSTAGFATFAMAHPLGIPQADGDFVIRDPLTTQPDGSLRCVAEIPDGTWVRMMEGSPDDLIAAARLAADQAKRAAGAPLSGALVFDCVSRALILGDDRMREELGAVHDALGADVPMLGCLTFGEVGALHHGVPQFHNKTAVVLGFSG